MKMNLKLTADELMNVVDATMDEAMEQGLYFDNFGNENVKEILTIVDAALSALSVEVVPADEDEEDEEWTHCDDCYHPNACDMCDYAEDDEDEEEETDPIESMIFDYNGKRTITSTMGKLLLDTCYAVVDARNPSMPFNTKVSKAKAMLMEIAKDYGIEWVTEEGE